MAQYRKKPVVIEARRFVTNNEPRPLNMNDLVSWMNQGSATMVAWHNGTDIFIRTLESGEGTYTATVGDWIIKGVKGEFYPCKPDIFDATYEPVSEVSESNARERY
jgi:hypothetical protein